MPNEDNTTSTTDSSGPSVSCTTTSGSTTGAPIYFNYIGIDPTPVTPPQPAPVHEPVVKDKVKHTCRECKTTVNVDTYGEYYYCKDCFEEISMSCDVCEKDFSSQGFLNKYRGTSGDIWVCSGCKHLVPHCHRCECAVIKKEEYTLCENCRGSFCQSCLQVHNCHSNLPIPARNYSGAVALGDVSKSVVIKHPGIVGIEIEAIGGNPSRLVLEKGIGISPDGSLRGPNPIELQTYPASYDVLEGIIDRTTKTMKDNGYHVNKSCGLHIHIDSTRFRDNPTMLFNIISTYYAVEPLIFRMLPPSRRVNPYTQPLRNWIDEIKMMEMANVKNLSIPYLENQWYRGGGEAKVTMFKGRKYDTSRYHGLNLHSLFSKKTLELRYHHGTLNATKIKRWIEFNLMIIDWAINSYDKGFVEEMYMNTDPFSKLRIMVKRMGISKNMRRYVLKGLRKFSMIV